MQEEMNEFWIANMNKLSEIGILNKTYNYTLKRLTKRDSKRSAAVEA